MSTQGWVCEHLFVMFADGLLLLFEMADRDDERFQVAAARWHGGADHLVVRRRLLALVERAGLATREIPGVGAGA